MIAYIRRVSLADLKFPVIPNTNIGVAEEESADVLKPLIQLTLRGYPGLSVWVGWKV